MIDIKVPRRDALPGWSWERRIFRAASISMWLMFVLACRRDEVTHARVKKEAPAESAALSAKDMPGIAPDGDVAPPPSPASAGGLKWQLPKGWREAKAGGMRYATLTPPVQGKIDVSIVVLPGPAGGELANVNRWRNQIGLPAIDDAVLASAREPLKSPAGTVSVYDFTSEGEAKTRMIAGLLVVGGNSWFLKMVGDADAVGAARGGFVHLLETLRID